MNRPYHILGGGDFLAGKLGDYVAGFEPGSIGRAILYHLGYQNTAFHSQFISGDGKLVNGVENNSQPRTDDVAVGDEFLDYWDSRFGTDGITHTLNADRGDFGAGDANHFSGQVDQWSAAVAGVNGSSGLDEVVQGLSRRYRYGNPLATDYSLSSPYTLAKSVTDGNHPLSNA